MTSILIDRLEFLVNRVAVLEEELVEEKKKSEKLAQELEISKGVVYKCKVKLARILKWKNLFDRLI